MNEVRGEIIHESYPSTYTYVRSLPIKEPILLSFAVPNDLILFLVC